MYFKTQILIGKFSDDILLQEQHIDNRNDINVLQQQTTKNKNDISSVSSRTTVLEGKASQPDYYFKYNTNT